MQHMAEKPRPLHAFVLERWARLSQMSRAAHNKLRIARGEPPTPAPKVDLYVPPPATSAPLPFNPADPEAVAAEREFRGLGDQAPDWEGAVKQLALELARDRLANRQLHTETLHRAIAQFVDLATRESGWPRKWIIEEAEKRYGVKTRTVETAISEYAKELAFIDSIKVDLTATTFDNLPVELRLMALGLPLLC